jgi:hypothetical protein
MALESQSQALALLCLSGPSPWRFIFIVPPRHASGFKMATVGKGYYLDTRMSVPNIHSSRVLFVLPVDGVSAVCKLRKVKSSYTICRLVCRPNNVIEKTTQRKVDIRNGITEKGVQGVIYILYDHGLSMVKIIQRGIRMQ